MDGNAKFVNHKVKKKKKKKKKKKGIVRLQEGPLIISPQNTSQTKLMGNNWSTIEISVSNMSKIYVTFASYIVFNTIA
jgi:hypothetical protein